MPSTKPRTTTDIASDDMTAEQLALPSSRARYAKTQYGVVQGGTVRNGTAVFLNVPYAQAVPRWNDPKPLDEVYRYSTKPYTNDGLYCAQRSRDDFPQPKRLTLGLGSPTESPFFADIYVPSTVALDTPDTTPHTLKPVKVFLHGGFLQFGSTSGFNYNQQFFPAEEFDEVRVLLAYRVSVLGFLSSEKHRLEGNYGFKDCWAGLEWVRENIAAFGGDPKEIHLSGMSGGAHVVQQLLHYAARHAPVKAPFDSATLFSNGILANAATVAEKETQFESVAHAAGIDPVDPDAVAQLRRVPISTLLASIGADSSQMVFRGVIGPGDGWVSEDQMEYQQSGRFASDLRTAGVQYVVCGDVRDEIAGYQLAHPCKDASEIIPNLERYYTARDSARLVDAYPALQPTPSVNDINLLQGQILADAQVHLPVRFLARDLARAGFPVVRYTIEYVAKALGTDGVVIHGSDLVIQQYRLSLLSQREAQMAVEWRERLEEEVKQVVRAPETVRGEDAVLTLGENGAIGWEEDWRWARLRRIEGAVRDV